MRAYELTNDMIDEAMIWSSPSLAALMLEEGVGDAGLPGAIILFKATDDLETALKNNNYSNVERDIVGSIKFGVFKNYTRVQMVSAEKGYGPLLYYLVMAKHGWLAPHHRDVSDQAKKVWRNFWDNPNMKREPIKNFHYEEYMSRSYALDNITNNKARNSLRHLLEMGDMFIKRIADNRKDREIRINQIDDAADDLMTAKMRTN